MNWLDFVLAAIILVTVIMGIIKGLVKQVVGLVAVVAGLILAGLYYRRVASSILAPIHNELLGHFLAFLLIFVLVLTAGALVGYLITKAMVGPLALINRVFGGGFALVKAVLICGVLVFAMTAFKFETSAVDESRLAPFCLGITRAVVNLVPQDLRTKFNDSYKEIRKGGGKNGEKI